MEKNEFIYLNVKTVPAFDTAVLCDHTAYMVYDHHGQMLRYASGWTLKDAVELYAHVYGCERMAIRLRRPFKHQ